MGTEEIFLGCDVKPDEVLVKINTKMLYRHKIFNVPYRLILSLRNVPFGNPAFNLDHESAALILRSMYPNLPKDLYVNSIMQKPGFPCFEVIASSETFEPVGELEFVPAFHENPL